MATAAVGASARQRRRPSGFPAIAPLGAARGVAGVPDRGALGECAPSVVAKERRAGGAWPDAIGSRWDVALRSGSTLGDAVAAATPLIPWEWRHGVGGTGFETSGAERMSGARRAGCNASLADPIARPRWSRRFVVDSRVTGRAQRCRAVLAALGRSVRQGSSCASRGSASTAIAGAARGDPRGGVPRRGSVSGAVERAGPKQRARTRRSQGNTADRGVGGGQPRWRFSSCARAGLGSRTSHGG